MILDNMQWFDGKVLLALWVVGAVAIMVFVHLTLAGIVFPVTVRYGLPLLPMFAVGLATAASAKRPGRVGLGVVAALSLVVVTTEMIGLM